MPRGSRRMVSRVCMEAASNAWLSDSSAVRRRSPGRCQVRYGVMVRHHCSSGRASCLGITGTPPAPVIARRGRRRSSSAQIFSARGSAEGQRRVYAPRDQPALVRQDERPNSVTRARASRAAGDVRVLIVPSVTNSSAASCRRCSYRPPASSAPRALALSGDRPHACVPASTGQAGELLDEAPRDRRGERSTSPAVTTCTACRSSSGGAFLSRKPLAPDRRASNTTRHAHVVRIHHPSCAARRLR